ncbi:MAG: MFS transporter [Prochloraceae cyanobacterium]|nr:MFS transporter [Prochloraceae cyanobacterium]
MTESKQLGGIKAFIVLWLGQLVSLVGSRITNFGLRVVVFQTTTSVTQFALISVCTILPVILLSPFAGVIVDRFDRRRVIIISDFGAFLTTVAIALLLLTGNLEVWHIYLTTAISSAFSAFQWPANIASVSMLVPKKHLPRASGLTQLGKAISQLISPILGAVMLVTVKLEGIILLDLITFIFSIFTLSLVRFPKLKTNISQQLSPALVLKEIGEGCKYIAARLGIFGLIIFLAGINFLVGAVEVLATPLILSFASTTTLGTILSIGGIGMVLGGVLFSIYPQARGYINITFNFTLLVGFCIVAAGLKASVILVSSAIFIVFFSLPFINGSSLLIFQRKVALEMQGRFFAINDTIAKTSLLVAYLITGPLADRIFEPLMDIKGLLANNVGQIIGVGPGRGIGLLFVIMGTLTMLLTIMAYQYPPLRFIEDSSPVQK